MFVLVFLSLYVFCVPLYVLLCLCYLERIIDYPFDYQTPISAWPWLVVQAFTRLPVTFGLKLEH